MGLRDRGFVLDYYIPLFAGVDAAKRARARTRFPFSLYAPYVSGGGTETPGGIGGGDGGFGAPIDFSVSTPTILTPVLGTVDASVCDMVTSSVFSSANGQTHVASRWLIEALNQDEAGHAINTATGIYVFDSGPDATHLAELPLDNLGLAPTGSYRVSVRYKGSDGGWSDWSVTRVFTLVDCSVDCTTSNTLDHDYSLSWDSSMLTTMSGTLALPAETAGWSYVKVYLKEAYWDDGGSVTGNVATIAPYFDSTTLGQYLGPNVLISTGHDPLSYTATNLAFGGFSMILKVHITGHAP